MAYLLGRLASGEKVYDRTQKPYTKTKPEMLAIIEEGLSKVCSSEGQDHLSVTVTLDRVVGLDYCVEVNLQQKEQIYYAQIVGRDGYSRFVYGVDPVPTACLTFVLNKRTYAKKKGYNIVTARYGREFLVEPWKRRVIEKLSLENPDFGKEVWKFWKFHAFAEGYKPIVSSTKTKKLPWRSPY